MLGNVIRIIAGALALAVCLAVATSEAHGHLVTALGALFVLGVVALVALAATRKK